MRINNKVFKSEQFQYFYKYSQRQGRTYVHLEDGNGEKKEKEVNLFAGFKPAISKNKTADYSVFTVVGIDEEHNIYILDFNKGKHTFREQKEQVVKMANKWTGLQKIGIETVVYQQALFQELSRVERLPITSINTTIDKVSKFDTLGLLIENEKMFFYSHIEGIEDMFNEFLEFPDAKYENILDSVFVAWKTGEQYNR